MRPTAPHARRRLLVAEIDRWFSVRWAWLRPRAVPLLAALVGLLVTLGAVKYVLVHGYRERMAFENRHTFPHASCDHVIQFVVEPIGHRDSHLEITLTPIELP